MSTITIRPAIMPNADLPVIAAKQPAKMSAAKKIAIGTLLLAGAAATTYAYKRDAIEQRFPGSMSGMEEKVSQAQTKMTQGLDKVQEKFPQFGTVRSTINDLPNRLPSQEQIDAFVNPVIGKANDFAAQAGDFLNKASDYVKSAVQSKEEPITKPLKEEPITKPRLVPTFELKHSNTSLAIEDKPVFGPINKKT